MEEENCEDEFQDHAESLTSSLSDDSFWQIQGAGEETNSFSSNSNTSSSSNNNSNSSSSQSSCNKLLLITCCNHSNFRPRLQCKHPQKSLQNISDWIDKENEPIYCALSGMPINQSCCIIVSRGLHVCYQHAESIATIFHTGRAIYNGNN